MFDFSQLSNAIKEAFEMILKGDIFTKNIIATSFMFGVIIGHATNKKPM